MDKKCIYCYSVDKNAKDWKGEHVISAQLGGPDAYQLYKEVCNSCNKKFGETIENVFREKSPEGYLACMYQVGRGSGYRTCSGDFGVEVETDEGNLSPDLFFHIDLQTETLRIPPQITFRAGPHHRYTTFERLSPAKLAEKLKWFHSKTIEAVAYGNIDDDPLATAEAAGFQLSEIEYGATIPAGTNLGSVKFKFQFEKICFASR